jgi:hypothetical protein
MFADLMNQLNSKTFELVGQGLKGERSYHKLEEYV